MPTLVTGGASCGKSEYAEQLALDQGGRRIYIATMQPYGDDAALRITRHRELRQGKGFNTIEWYTDLERLQIAKGFTVLLECLGNLAANELFREGADYQTARRNILDGLASLCAQADELIIVNNDITSDGCVYTAETQQYIDLLADVTSAFIGSCSRVIEVVCGIPIWHRGQPL